MLLLSDLPTVLANAADAYTPALLVLALINTVISWRHGDKLRGLWLAYFAIIVYGLMFADLRFSIWSAMGLDFSTHTAAALALVVYNSLQKNILVKILLVISLLLYGCVMDVLDYHSWSDMFSTAFVIGIFLTPVLFKKTATESITKYSRSK